MTRATTPLPWRITDGDPLASPDATIQGDHYRIQVLTDALVRVEYSPSGQFEDRRTQVVINRAFGTPRFSVTPHGDGVQVSTEHFDLSYDGHDFSDQGLWLSSRSGDFAHGAVWRYGVTRPTVYPLTTNLGGTARTLDMVDGRTDLGLGLMHPQGYAALDDSTGMALDESGWVAPREPGNRDLYLFVYGRRYREALRAFYRLTGPQPLLPRWALGNWWSRFEAYSADSYLALLDRFEAEGVPLSVAVLDMDWHLTDIDPVHGTGWTGFTWNRDLFPDPGAFLAELHRRGLATSLNLHPADGIRSFEDCYERVSAALGRDAAEGQPIPFDVGDPAFLRAYTEQVLHPMEDIGVDSWWLDWQQGDYSSVPGLDPLWMLNHVHYLDACRAGRRGITLSRYAGPGSHRYPLGFSGDTQISWASLDFQPEFTATASNVGFGWWSHDIGGHWAGRKDPELTTRWVQLGCWSPINRLHSVGNPFVRKEPWAFEEPYRSAMVSALRMRHRLLPYLHSMNHRAHADGLPLVEPLYYQDPNSPQAYENRNQFFFGPDLLVNPLTSPVDQATRLAAVRAWLPQGEWVDLDTGRRYTGGRFVRLHRPLTSYPVLLRAGGVLVWDGEARQGADHPTQLEIVLTPGANGEFELYEDDPDDASVTAITRISHADGRLVVHPTVGDLALPGRSWRLRVVGCEPAGDLPDGAVWDASRRSIAVELGEAGREGFSVGVAWAAPDRPDSLAWCEEILQRAETDSMARNDLWGGLAAATTDLQRVAVVEAAPVPDALREALLEALLARV